MKREKNLRFINSRILGARVQSLNAAMQAGTINALIVCAAIAGLFIATANAADITWQTPVTISGTSDVSTLGTVVGTWAPGDDAYNPDSLPVNGVTFNAYGSGPFNSVSITGMDGHYTGFNSPGTADTNYNTILKAAIYSNGSSISLTWGGMAPGDNYLIEFWVQDGRNSTTAERSETLTGGANTSAALAYGFGDSGPGQYIIGTFVADGTGTQTITLNASAGNDIVPSAQVNLLQLRNLTPRPNVTWRSPVTISGTSDVSTQGTYFGSWAPADVSANTNSVNGVTFQGFSDLPYFASGPTFDNHYDGFGSPNTSDNYYNTLLKYATFSNEGATPASVTWSGMTPGNTYLVQLWVNDGRSIGESRSETVTGGTNTSAPLSFGSDGSGPGQYIIGTFVANSSGGQTLMLTPSSTGSSPNAQINLFQVRDITATLVSAPTITGIAVSGTTLTLTATNGPANAAFVLLESATVTRPLMQWTPVLTNSFDANGAINLSTNVVSTSNPQQFYILRTQQ